MSELLLYTAQAPVVTEALERDGVSRVRKAYVDQKYGETAWVFQTAYAFFRREMALRIPPPPGAESPVWLYADSRWCFMGPESRLLCFRVPKEQALVFDRRLWNRILNLEYLGRDEADEARFQKELAGIGLNGTQPVFSTAFYPLQKRKIQDSWKRLFAPAEIPEVYRQAAVWELRREWLAEAPET
jgi:hypothetical protein